MIAISVNDISLHFGTSVILDKISFSLEENDKLGIIGINGSGKTSLFKIITGEYEPSGGNVYISKGKTVGILTQTGALDAVGDSAEQTALERMYPAFPHLLSMEKRIAQLEELIKNSPSSEVSDEYAYLLEKYASEGGLEFRGRCASILTKLGFTEKEAKSPLSILSGGQKTRLALAIELSREPDILMLDEPTNHLDIETLTWLENFLRDYKKCVMVISHDRYFLDKVTNKTLSIEYHRAKLYGGNYSKSMEQRRVDRELAEKHYRDQQKEIARQEAYIAQQRQWNRERNIIAAESRQKMLDKMVKLEKPKDDPRAIKMQFTTAIESGNDVLDVRELSMSFPTKKLFEKISFEVKKRDRLFIVGPNGCGKSTLIKLILSRLAATGGRIDFGYNVQIGYYDQENQNLDESATVIDELWNAYPSLEEVKIRSTLASFRFFGEDVFKPIRVLSGGERARLTLAKLILSKMNLLVLDEPTNHLDIDSREALEEALSAFDGTIVAVSHDRYFIEKLATRIIGLCPEVYFEKGVADFKITRHGAGFDEYLEFIESRKLLAGNATEALTKSAPISQSKEQYMQNKREQADVRKRQNRIRKLTEESERLEKRLDEISAELYGDAASDYVRAAELDKEKEETEEKLLLIYEELEELEVQN